MYTTRQDMKLLTVNYKTPPKIQEGLALCLGYFDGVHLGHVALIKHGHMNRIYDGEDNLALGVLTFNNPIAKFKDNGKSKEILTTIEDRSSMISNLDIVDYLLVMHVDANFTNLSPEDFINILKKMNVKQVFCGSDYHFGKDGAGDVELLNKHFVVNVLDIHNPFEEKISTHTIIDHIKNGEIEKANKELGYHYAITGKVVQGKKKGRDLGFPTMNVKPVANYVLPKFGVYKSRVVVGVREYLGMTNVGMRPTLGYEGEEPGIETHLIDIKVDELYGEEVIVTFEEFIREEKKFDSVDELKAQIARDLESIKKTVPAQGNYRPVVDNSPLKLSDNLDRLVIDFGYNPDVVRKVLSNSIVTVRGFLGSEEVLKNVLTPEELNDLKKVIASHMIY